MLWPSSPLTPLEIVDLLIGWGSHFSNEDAKDIVAYFEAMIEHERVVLIREEGEVIAFCTFFLTWYEQDILLFHDRPMWSLPKHNVGLRRGNYCYIDKLACNRPWTRSLRNKVARVITRAYGEVDTAVWHRPGRGHSPDYHVVRPVKEVKYG